MKNRDDIKIEDRIISLLEKHGYAKLQIDYLQKEIVTYKILSSPESSRLFSGDIAGKLKSVVIQYSNLLYQATAFLKDKITQHERELIDNYVKTLEGESGLKRNDASIDNDYTYRTNKRV